MEKKSRTDILHNDADLLRQRCAPHRPRLHDDHRRRPGPLPEARRQGRLLPDGHGRARPEDREGGRRKGVTPQALADSVVGPVPGPLESPRTSPTISSSGRPRPSTSRASRSSSRSSSTRATSTRANTRDGTASPTRTSWPRTCRCEEDGVKICPDCGKKATVVAEETYFFRLSAYQEPLLESLRRPPGVRPAAEPDERGRELRPGRAQGPEHHPDDGQVGHPRPGRPGPHDLRLVRRPPQLPDRDRLRLEHAALREILAGRRSTSSARTSCASTPSSGRPS